MPPKPTAARRGAKRDGSQNSGKKHLDDLLDEALDETFPASDPPAMLEPTPNSGKEDTDGKSS